MTKFLNKLIDPPLRILQSIISSPLWALGTIAITVYWMVYERWFAAHPVDGPQNGWAYTVLIYTLVTMWLEGFMKVQQAEQSKAQQHQMDRIEFILRYLQDQSGIVHEMLNRNAKSDAIIHHLIGVTNKTAAQLLDLAEKDNI
jgi:hypothetical protein